MGVLKCGFARREITPSLRGNFLDGYGFRLSPAEGVRDPLWVQVCVLSAGGEPHMIASVDLIGFSPRVYRLIADQVEGLTGIPAERQSLCCIHTHAAPVSGVLDELPVDWDYLAWVGEQIGRAALAAVDAAVPGHFSFDRPKEKLIHCYNRRGRDVIDPSIHMASFIDEGGRVRGVICSASCHAVIQGGMTVSADFLSVLNAAQTDDCPILYLQDRGADIDPMRGGELDTDTAIDLLGHELSDPVTAAAAARAGECRPATEGVLTTRYETVTLPVKPLPSADELRAVIRANEEAYFAKDPSDITKHYVFRELQWARKMLRMALAGETPALTVPLQLLALGHDLVFAFVPFEMLTLTGQALERILIDAGFEPVTVFTVGYANSVNGYLAPKDEFPYGGYEVSGASHWYGLPENDESTEPAMLAAFARMAGTL